MRKKVKTMSNVYEMAKKYYPDKWNRAQIDHLYEIDKLTEEEYNQYLMSLKDEKPPLAVRELQK